VSPALPVHNKRKRMAMTDGVMITCIPPAPINWPVSLAQPGGVHNMRKATAMAEGVQRGAKRMKRRRGGKRERKKRAREAARQLQHSATPIAAESVAGETQQQPTSATPIAAGKAAATLSRETQQQPTSASLIAADRPPPNKPARREWEITAIKYYQTNGRGARVPRGMPKGKPWRPCS
jgi:hypothetical protein